MVLKYVLVQGASFQKSSPFTIQVLGPAQKQCLHCICGMLSCYAFSRFVSTNTPYCKAAIIAHFVFRPTRTATSSQGQAICT
jgi:hypothetical protein